MAIRTIRLFVVFMVCAIARAPIAVSAQKTTDERVVKDGLLITIDYTMKTPDGKVLETSKGYKPLQYIHGKKMMIPGLEKALTGMKVGEEKQVTVKPEEGYGKINPNAVMEVPKDKVPPNALKIGAVLVGTNKEGMPIPLTVREIKDKTVVMDLNHPLAGKTLVFDVKVIDIGPAPAMPSLAKPGAPAKPTAPSQPK